MIRKIDVTRLVVAAMFLSSSSMVATTYSQKTFFSPRAVGANRAMEYTTWHDVAFQKVKAPSKSSINSHVALTAFYQASQKGEALGKFFGIGNDKNYFKVGSFNNIVPEVIEVVNNFLIHKRVNHDDSTLAGTVYFTPKQELYGVRLDYFQDVNTPFKNVFFKASVPVVRVQNDMKLVVENGASVTPAVAAGAVATPYSLTDFFKGDVSVTDGIDKQSPLTKAKINGRRSATGIADVNLALGYKLHQTHQDFLFCNAGIIVPTGNRVRGEYLFEPVCGNGKHFGISAGFDGGLTLWEGKKAAATMQVALDYRYLFEGTEYRTLSLNKSFIPAAQLGALNHYYLIGQKDVTGCQPAANIFTQGLRVQPGSQFEALTNFSFTCCGFVVDLGYNAFYKEKESMWIKTWDKTKYGVAIRDFEAHNNFTLLAAAAVIPDGRASGAILKSDFDLESVTHPSQFTHKVLGGLGYTFTLAKKYVTGLGAGASYEFAADNAAMENYAFWLKGSISF